MRKLCLVYWLLLTLLLLARNPLAWFGSSRVVSTAYTALEPAMHFVCFLLLAVLVCATRLPIARGGLIALLVGYSIATELLQALVPGRTPDAKDFLQDIAGLAAGAGLYWIVRHLVGRLRPIDALGNWHVPRRRAAAVGAETSSEAS